MSKNAPEQSDMKTKMLTKEELRKMMAPPSPRWCSQCQVFLESETNQEFISHYQSTHGRLPSAGEYSQAVNHFVGGYSFGKLRNQPGVFQGGSPGLGNKK